MYRPVRPQTPGKGAVFFAEYTAGPRSSPAKMVLKGTEGKTLEITSLPGLPPSDEETRVVFEYRVPEDFTLQEIVAHRAPDYPDEPPYNPLREAGFRPPDGGISFSQNSVTVAAGYRLSWSDREITIALPGAEADTGEVPGEGGSVKLAYEGEVPPYGAEDGSEPVSVAVDGPAGERTALFTPRAGANSLFFHPAAWEGDFDRITLEGIDDSFRPVALTPGEPPESLNSPIDLEAGSILRFDTSAWRREDFELFRWNLFPSILVFDTRDYAVQAGMFKRLAFFVEKRGYIGKLLSDGELEGKHGWNAHDYRAIDLAAFFQAAADRHFALGEEELRLRDTLLENGIIRYDGGMYLPGDGGVISLSRESSDYLRRKFMVHEGYHGVFFASREFRERCFELFEGRPDRERRFWADFFGLMGYGVENRYLLVNEYQAYLLQQPVGEAENYFRAHWAYRRLAGDGEVFDAGTSPFIEAAREMERTVHDYFGLKAGELFCLDGYARGSVQSYVSRK